jgi:hypothetical protein
MPKADFKNTFKVVETKIHTYCRKVAERRKAQIEDLYATRKHFTHAIKLLSFLNKMR